MHDGLLGVVVELFLLFARQSQEVGSTKCLYLEWEGKQHKGEIRQCTPREDVALIQPPRLLTTDLVVGDVQLL
jgi:hypothetical protein